VPSWHCRCKNGLGKASTPQNLPFLLPGVLLPCADATQCFPERPWGWVGAASARGLALPVQSWPQKGLSAPNTSHFHLQRAPLMCWRHTMLSWTTLRLGWGCISSGEGPSSSLHGNWKLDAVLDSWLIICVLFIENCCKKENNSFGLKPEPNGQITVKIVLCGGHHLVRSDTVILANRNLDRTVRGNYG